MIEAGRGVDARLHRRAQVERRRPPPRPASGWRRVRRTAPWPATRRRAPPPRPARATRRRRRTCRSGSRRRRRAPRSRGLAEREQRPTDRSVARHDDEQGGHDRLQEDLERAAGQARVVDRELARLLTPRASGVIRSSIVSPESSSASACARTVDSAQVPPTKPSHRAVGQHDRLVARLRRRRSLGQHHPGEHERAPGRLAARGAVVLTAQIELHGSGHSIARSVRNGLPCIARHTAAGVSGMSAWRTWMRVEHGVDDRRRRTHGGRLADALRADRVVRRRRDRLAELPARALHRRRQEVVHERAAEVVAALVERHHLHQRHAHAVGEAAVHLALDDHRVDARAAVVDGDEPADLDLRRSPCRRRRRRCRRRTGT